MTKVLKTYPKNYKGDKGAEIEMYVATRGASSFIQTKYDTHISWNDLINLSLLQGANGDPVVLRSTNTALQWKYSSQAESQWQVLVAYSDLPAGGGIAIKGSGTNVQSSGTVEFTNANGISWQLTAGSMQISHALQYTSATSLITSNAMNTSERANYLASGQSSNYRHTSADSQLQFTSANTLFLGTAATQSFRHTSADSQLQFTSANSLLQYTSATSNITSNAVNTSAPRIQGIVFSNQTQTAGSVVFSGSNGITVRSAASTVIIEFDGHHIDGFIAAGNGNGTGFSSMSSGTMLFYFTGDISASQNGNNLSISVPAGMLTSERNNYLYTSNSSNNTSVWFANTATTKFAGTGTSATNASITLNSNGLAISVAAPGGGGGFAIKGSGTYTQNTGTVEFSASNGITFVMNGTGNQMTVTHELQYTSQNSLSLGTAATQSFFFTSASSLLQHTSATSAITSNALNTSVSRIPWIAGSAASSVTNGGVLFQTGNGITFGLNGSTMTASHNAYSATSQFSASFINTGQARIGQIAASNSSYTSGSIVLSGSTNLTVSYNGSSILMSVADAIPLGNSTYYQTSNLSNTFFVASQTTKFAGTGTTFNGANISGSLTQNSNGIQMSLSVAAPGGGGVAIAGSNTTYTSGTVIFRGTNLTVNTSAGGQYIDLSVAAPGAAAENNWITLGGNVASNSSASGSTIQWIGGNNITLAGTNNSQIRIDADYKANYTQTYFTYQNRLIGASTHIAPGQNSLWLVPFRVQQYLSASTLLQMMTITGTFTSAATAQFGLTLERVIYSQNATDTTRWDSLWSTQQTMRVWNSGTSSMSFAWDGYTTSSAATGNVANSLTGMRLLTANIGSVITPGLYMFGMRMSTSSANYSALVRTYNPVFDNPVSVGKNYLGLATATNVGYNDGGVYSVTTGAIPSSVGFGQIRQFYDVMPYFKIGGI